MFDFSFIYISRTPYSKDCKQVATAVKDASSCGCQECDRVPAMNRWHRFCLIPGENHQIVRPSSKLQVANRKCTDNCCRGFETRTLYI
ncbi:hypothetical protein [Nostoc sp. UHCC 0251]|uniref:hypothetical protein n=1 Tax=Nostoc sp. UHCC 0251 TaxID=3110240 RepID=UPI002B218C16|nr:hypothetical protein [Nostoc sp. UHCC 0251]MEA5624318.1 hypothetical protein [Nostoc sp. UHCC 0251]